MERDTMRARKILSAGAAALALTAASFAVASPASSADLWVYDGTNLTGGVDYWNWDDSNLQGDTFSTGASENDAISSLDSNWGASIIFYTGASRGGTPYAVGAYGIRNTLPAGINNAISSIYFD